MKRCFNCKGRLVRSPNVHVEDVGGVKVTDATQYALKCEKCGDVFLSAHQLQEYELRAAALVLRDGRFVKGAVVRYARHAIGLREFDLAIIFDYDTETIYLWELDAQKVSRRDMLALAGLLDGVREGQSTTRSLLDENDFEKKGSSELQVPRGIQIETRRQV